MAVDGPAFQCGNPAPETTCNLTATISVPFLFFRALEGPPDKDRFTGALRLHDISFELVPREAPFFLCRTLAGFPSPAQDDMQDPIDLGAWLVEHLAVRLQPPFAFGHDTCAIVQFGWAIAQAYPQRPTRR